MMLSQFMVVMMSHQLIYLFNKILIKYKSQDQNQHIICCLLRIKEIKPFYFAFQVKKCFNIAFIN